MLRTERLSLGYPGRTLVEGLTLEFLPGQIWAVLGRNGSGKSTLLHALAALRRPQSGAALLDGAPLDSIPRRRLARRIGVLLQEEAHEFWGSVRDFVLLGRYPHALSPFGWHMDDEAVARGEIESLHLAGLADRAFASSFRRRAPTRARGGLVCATAARIPAGRTAATSRFVAPGGGARAPGA